MEKLKHLFKSPTVQPFAKLILITLMIAFSGAYTIKAYLFLILQNLNLDIQPSIFALILTLMGMTGMTAYLYITHQWRQKPQLVTAFIIAAAFNTAFLGYVILQSIGSIMSHTWVALVILLPYVFSIRLGETAFARMKKDLLCESLRNTGLQFLLVILYLAAFVACSLYPKIMEVLGKEVLISIFSICCAATAIVLYALPETMNHTPQPTTLNTATGETDDNTAVTTVSTHL